MLYKHTKDNMKALMQQVGFLEREQIIRFFSDAMPAQNVDKLIRELISYNTLKEDPVTGLIYYSAAPELKPFIRNGRIKAFWVLANWGSENINAVYTLNYPSQFMIISSDNIAFDVTVCNSTNEAQIVRHMWDANAIKGVPDDINHIAVVDNHELGSKLKVYGFDNYCIIDPFTSETDYYNYDA